MQHAAEMNVLSEVLVKKLEMVHAEYRTLRS
jgi:hypothetical protein